MHAYTLRRVRMYICRCVYGTRSNTYMTAVFASIKAFPWIYTYYTQINFFSPPVNECFSDPEKSGGVYARLLIGPINQAIIFIIWERERECIMLLVSRYIWFATVSWKFLCSESNFVFCRKSHSANVFFSLRFADKFQRQMFSDEKLLESPCCSPSIDIAKILSYHPRSAITSVRFPIKTAIFHFLFLLYAD